MYPYLCRAVRNYVRDHTELSVEKEYYLSIVDVPTRHKVRELSTHKVGTLIRISGQVSVDAEWVVLFVCGFFYLLWTWNGL